MVNGITSQDSHIMGHIDMMGWSMMGNHTYYDSYSSLAWVFLKMGDTSFFGPYHDATEVGKVAFIGSGFVPKIGTT